MYTFLKARKNYVKGEEIIKLVNQKCDSSNPRRIQIDETIYIEPPISIYHSCNPNAYIEWNSLVLKALTNIKRGELITYHYGTSEDDYTVGAFTCTCRSDNCIGYFRGFKFMTKIQRNKIKKYISPYLHKIYYGIIVS